MKQNNTHSANAELDRTVAQIRNEEIDHTMVENAAERVWTRIAEEHTAAAASAMSATPATMMMTAPAEQIRSCADFQTLIPVYLQGDLSNARALLLEDHTRECIPCRRTLKEVRARRHHHHVDLAAKRNEAAPLVTANVTANVTAKTGGGRLAATAAHPWRIAAGLVVACGLLALFFLIERRLPVDAPFGRAGGAITVQVADGLVYRIADATNHRVNAGDRVKRGELVRTAKDSHAMVRLADGSLIEMRERSEFSISENSGGATIHLEQGNIIVQAAKQRSTHLYVATPDSLVSVTGTIFAVNSGTKGSRVSVVEGEVHVNHAGDEQILRPGDQATTHQSLERVPVKEEIAWSRDAERYTQLVAELSALRKELDEKVARPGVRYSTRLLDLMPERTVFYAALPNLSQTLSQSHRIIEERIGQNAALREWWRRKDTAAGNGADTPDEITLSQIIERTREFGDQLGDEITVSAEMNEQGQPEAPLVLAEIKNAASFRTYLEGLENEVRKLGAGPQDEAKRKVSVRFVDDPLGPLASQTVDEKREVEIFVWITEDFAAFAPQAAVLQRLATNLKAPGALSRNKFIGASFHTRIAELYREGAGLIVAADLEKIVPQVMSQPTASADGEQLPGRRADVYQQLGLLDLKHFIVELKESGGKKQNRAVLSFNEPRRGMASWLAAPGPMGALEFISPDASMVAAFVVKEPVALIDDLLVSLKNIDANLWGHLRDLESQHGVNIQQDLAAPLGGEFAFAIDGPLLPLPSWKVIFEVYDPARLQTTFEHVVTELNKWAAREGKAGLQWERSEQGGRTFYTLKSADTGLEINYTFVNGYFVAGPSRALVDRAIRYHDSDYTLLRSSRFTAALPEDGQANFSALIYQNLAPMLEPLASRLGKSVERLPENAGGKLKLITDGAPVMAYAYAQDDRIIFSAGSENGPFGLTPGSLFGLRSSFGIGHVFEEGMRSNPQQ